MGIVRGVGGLLRCRVTTALTVISLAATACGSGGTDDVVSPPRISTGALAAVQLSLGDLALEPGEIEEGAGVFLVPRGRIVFADVSCRGDLDEGLVVRAEGEFLETLQRVRLQMSVTGRSVAPAEGDLEILVGDPDQGLALTSVTGVAVDEGLVSVEGVYEPRTRHTPLRERLVGGSFRLVVRCSA